MAVTAGRVKENEMRAAITLSILLVAAQNLCAWEPIIEARMTLLVAAQNLCAWEPIIEARMTEREQAVIVGASWKFGKVKQNPAFDHLREKPVVKTEYVMEAVPLYPQMVVGANYAMGKAEFENLSAEDAIKYLDGLKSGGGETAYTENWAVREYNRKTGVETEASFWKSPSGITCIVGGMALLGIVIYKALDEGGDHSETVYYGDHYNNRDGEQTVDRSYTSQPSDEEPAE